MPKKAHNNIGVIGNIDLESTTTGNLIYKSSGIDEWTVEKFEKESQQLARARSSVGP